MMIIMANVAIGALFTANFMADFKAKAAHSLEIGQWEMCGHWR
jgi:hypothetical protein